MSKDSLNFQQYVYYLSPLLLLITFIICTQGFYLSDISQNFYKDLRFLYPFWNKVLKFFTDYGNFICYTFYIIILLNAYRTKKNEDIYFVYSLIKFSLIIVLLGTQFLKNTFGMPRPEFSYPPQPFAFEYAYSSFPSGHTTEIVAIALPLIFWFSKQKYRILLSILIAIVAFSRVWFNSHHPIDILGGVVLGTIAAQYILKDTRQYRNMLSFRRAIL